MTNPQAATGGADPDSVDDVCTNAPQTVLTLGRAVSIADYQNFAATFAGIAQAYAIWIPSGVSRGVFLTIATKGGTDLPLGNPTLTNLITALKSYSNPLIPVTAVSFMETLFGFSADVKYDPSFDQPTVRAAIWQMLVTEFSFANRAFGQGVSADEIATVIQGVAGVIAVNVTGLTPLQSSTAGDLANLSGGFTVSNWNTWMSQQVLSIPRPNADTTSRICPYIPVASSNGQPLPAEILGPQPRSHSGHAGGDVMNTPPVTVRSNLFNLLPALYRLRDAQLAASAGYEIGPLQSLLSIVEEQIAIVEENITQLYDDLFIETCAPWVVPYIGDLIGYKQINGIASAVDSPRAEVANTIGFRRRKGTVPVLEQLARDATGWGAHAVEFFEMLATTQCVRNHVRPLNYYAPNLRSWKPREFMDTGFDKTAHKVDVRRIRPAPDQDQVPGGLSRYNVQNVGIFLWSLNAYTLTEVPATAISGSSQCFRFSTLGADMPLFHRATELPEETTTLAAPSNVPDRLTRHLLCQDIRAITKKGLSPVYYGPGLSLAIYSNGSLQDASRILVADLSGADGSWANLAHLSDLSNLPAGANTIAVDPRLGRIAIPPPTTGAAPSFSTFCCYGFNTAIGGGEYPRASTFTASPEQAIVRVPGDYASIHDALAALSGDGVVEVSNSGVYSESAGLTINVRANGHIELRAADGSRPTLVLGDAISITGGSGAQFNLNGFLITYAPPEATSKPPAALLYSPGVKANELANLGVTHCTFVPGWALEPNGQPSANSSGELTYAGPAVFVDSSGLAVTIAQSILGPLYLNSEFHRLALDTRSSTQAIPRRSRSSPLSSPPVRPSPRAHSQ